MVITIIENKYVIRKTAVEFLFTLYYLVILISRNPERFPAAFTSVDSDIGLSSLKSRRKYKTAGTLCSLLYMCSSRLIFVRNPDLN